MTTENTVTNELTSDLNKTLLDDEAILELAKRRLAIKKNLFSQALDFALILFCLGLLILVDYAGERFIIVFFFSAFWGIRLLYRIFKFAKPSFKDGISAYLKKRNDYQIESEFNRIKKEYLSNGL